MKIVKWFMLAMILALFASGCASRKAPADSGSTSENSASQRTATNDKSKEAPAAKSSEGEIVGTPARGSKFSKIKLGMTLAEVAAKIGAPTKQWTHPTGKSAIPFYFGPDRWVIEYSYKGEGLLTFNQGGAQVLTKIQVNKSEGK
jgi:hypothetical protein